MVGMVGVGSNSHEQLARATRTRRRPRRKGPNLAGPTVVSFRAVLECTNAVLRQAKLPNYFFVHVNAAPPRAPSCAAGLRTFAGEPESVGTGDSPTDRAWRVVRAIQAGRSCELLVRVASQRQPNPTQPNRQRCGNRLYTLASDHSRHLRLQRWPHH